jgi:hypothetical protein
MTRDSFSDLALILRGRKKEGEEAAVRQLPRQFGGYQKKVVPIAKASSWIVVLI